MSDLDGMAALTDAVHKGDWPHTMDARVWAQQFTEHFKDKPYDEGDLIAWFANAIMAGYDAACARKVRAE